MRLIGALLVISVALAALEAAAAVIVLLIVGAIVTSAIFQPRATFGALLCLVALGAMGTYPLVTLLLAALLMAIGLFPRR
jgi:hypothetical protein